MPCDNPFLRYQNLDIQRNPLSIVEYDTNKMSHEEDMSDDLTLMLSAPGREFVVPYIEAAHPGVRIAGIGAERADVAIMLSGTEIYAMPDGADLAGIDAAVDGRLPLARAEVDYVAACRRLGLRPLILRCANTVGTGMTGYPRRLAESIAKGFFFHFPDNDARISAVHAADVASLVADIVEGRAVPQRDIYIVTDGDNPTLHDFADALAYRMNDKRISNLSTWGQRMAGRIFYGTAYRRYTTTETYDGGAAFRELGFTPTPVVRYLREHVYDENSL